jgi:tRNA threonylcarbamoyladenosine biosynthesis protein TsaB
MRVLALESSTDWLSVAAGDGATWHERVERAGVAASQRMLPLAMETLAEAGFDLAGLDAIAFGAGPGAFTGVRIACGVAQGLALGADVPLVGVSGLEALAQGATRTHAAIHVLACLDARMREVYVAAYRREDADPAGWRVAQAPAVMAPAEVRAPPGTWHGCGDGFARYPELARRDGVASVDADAFPRAGDIAALALPRIARGDVVDAAAAEPLYVRHRVALTTAERNAGARL